MRSLIPVLLLLLAVSFAVYRVVHMPGASHRGALSPLTAEERVSATRLERHVTALAEDIGPRNHQDQRSYTAATRYIEEAFERLGYRVEGQDYTPGTRPARNIEATLLGSELPGQIIVIGAHYDSVSGCPGANDNASGVAGLLEAAALLGKTKPRRTLRFVAFANEEPPYFKQPTMGSLVYARRCAERREDVIGMLSLETIGFYSDAPGSQAYPPPFSFFYPSEANFIAFVGDDASRQLVHRSIASFRSHTEFPSEGIAAPGHIPGISWSDHWSFWQVGIPAVMVTDTAPFRYRWYHTKGDRADKLDYARMSRVVAGVTRVIADLAEAGF